MTAPAIETWRDYADRLTPGQFDYLQRADSAPWTEHPDRKGRSLLAIARASAGVVE